MSKFKTDEEAWLGCDHEDAWVFNKLEVARRFHKEGTFIPAFEKGEGKDRAGFLVEKCPENYQKN